MKNFGKRNARPKPLRSKSLQRHSFIVGGPTDNMSAAHRSKTMSCIRSRDTTPELIIRRLAHRLGFRFRLCNRDLPGSPDLVFPRLNCVIFVHGCFWHAHSCNKGARRPLHNASQWRAKLERNNIRDRHALRKLRRLGWRVLVIWECQLKRPALVEQRLLVFLRT